MCGKGVYGKSLYQFKKKKKRKKIVDNMEVCFVCCDKDTLKMSYHSVN